jgi:2-C-methyl-D-erythritol 4-phosphate cytidylyltransferase
VHSVRALADAPSVDVVVVSAPEADVQGVTDLLADLSFDARIRVVAGGSSRQASVANALAVLDDDVDVVLVHDAARPLVPVDLIESVVAAVRAGHVAVVPGMPVADTIKRIDAADVVVETLDRGALRAVQTPQGFARGVLDDAHARAAAGALGDVATDDAGLVERCGHPTFVVHGSEEAFKVTRPLDLLLAEALLVRREGTT